MSDSRGQRSVVGSQGNQSSLENKTFTENRHKNNKKKISDGKVRLYPKIADGKVLVCQKEKTLKKNGLEKSLQISAETRPRCCWSPVPVALLSSTL